MRYCDRGIPRYRTVPGAERVARQTLVAPARKEGAHAFSRSLPVDDVGVRVSEYREHRRQQPRVLVLQARADAIDDDVHLPNGTHAPQLSPLRFDPRDERKRVPHNEKPGGKVKRERGVGV